MVHVPASQCLIAGGYSSFTYWKPKTSVSRFQSATDRWPWCRDPTHGMRRYPTWSFEIGVGKMLSFFSIQRYFFCIGIPQIIINHASHWTIFVLTPRWLEWLHPFYGNLHMDLFENMVPPKFIGESSLSPWFVGNWRGYNYRLFGYFQTAPNPKKFPCSMDIMGL